MWTEGWAVRRLKDGLRGWAAPTGGGEGRAPAVRCSRVGPGLAGLACLQRRRRRARCPTLCWSPRSHRRRLLRAARGLREATAGRQLPRQVCHADANEGNLLVDEQRTQAGTGVAPGLVEGRAVDACRPGRVGLRASWAAAATQVTGLLDFGDACWCWRAAEVAVAMTYAALLPQLPGERGRGAQVLCARGRRLVPAAGVHRPGWLVQTRVAV